MKPIEQMSEEELAEFARERFTCMYYKLRKFDGCEMCRGQNTRCDYYISRSHFEQFYTVFGLEDKLNEIGGKNETKI